MTAEESESSGNLCAELLLGMPTSLGWLGWLCSSRSPLKWAATVKQHQGFNKLRQPAEFQQHIRDFLIQLKVKSSAGAPDFFGPCCNVEVDVLLIAPLPPKNKYRFFARSGFWIRVIRYFAVFIFLWTRCTLFAGQIPIFADQIRVSLSYS